MILRRSDHIAKRLVDCHDGKGVLWYTEKKARGHIFTLHRPDDRRGRFGAWRRLGKTSAATWLSPAARSLAPSGSGDG